MNITHTHSGVLGEITDLLIQLELEHHYRGWDNTPPSLYRVGRNNTGELDIIRAHLGMLEGLHPRVELARMAGAVRQRPAMAELIEAHFDGPPLAHLLIFESWQHGSRTPEEHEADPRSLADVPGSFEARCGIAVIGKTLMAVNRIRGEQPVLVDPTSDPTAGLVLQPGGLLASLVDYHQGITAHWRGRLANQN